MIPNGTWSNITAKENFESFGLFIPEERFSKVFDIQIGPKDISQSEGNLTARQWIVYQKDNEVLLRKAEGLVWSEPLTLFEEYETIKAMALSWDNLGRPVLFFQIGIQLVLWFFDSTINDMVFKTISNNGKEPKAYFDYPTNTSNPDSDVMIFYVENDSIYYRMQRDRYVEVFFTGIQTPEVSLLKVGKTTGGRFQVLYQKNV